MDPQDVRPAGALRTTQYRSRAPPPPQEGCVYPDICPQLQPLCPNCLHQSGSLLSERLYLPQLLLHETQLSLTESHPPALQGPSGLSLPLSASLASGRAHTCCSLSHLPKWLHMYSGHLSPSWTVSSVVKDHDPLSSVSKARCCLANYSPR